MALTQDLVGIVSKAWDDYVQTKVSKGLPETLRPVVGKEIESWSDLVNRFQDREWKQECLKRDEKFEMHFTAAVCIL